MKRLLLALVLISTLNVGMSQCTPDPMYADSIFGVWPDTLENFPPAMLGVEYSSQLDLLVPTNAGQIPNLGLLPLPIDSGSVTAVSGLPEGLSYECNSQTTAPCTFIGGEQGCAVLSGIPLEIGTFEIEIAVLAHLSLLGSPLSAPITFGGYRIVVSDTTIGLEESDQRVMTLGQNEPNPFKGITTIPFELLKNEEVQIIVMDLLGVEVHRTTISGSIGKNEYVFQAESIPQGIYLYSLSTASNTATRRMVIGR